MKKVILSALAFSMLFMACEKDEVVQVNNAQIEINPNSTNIDGFDGVKINNKYSVLEFETIEYYEQIVDNEDYNQVDLLTKAINQSDFSSYGKVFSNNNICDDDFTNAILNEESIVKIEDWFIKIDMIRGLVYLNKYKDENSYANLVNQKSINIYTLSTEDDVLDYIKDETLLTSKKKEWFCGEKGQGHDTEQQNWYEYCTDYEYKFKSSYWTIGIYKVLKLGFYHNNLGGSDDVTDFSLSYRYSYKKRCRDSGGGAVDFPTNITYNYTDDNLVLKFYQGTRSLSKYYIGDVNASGSGPSCRLRSKCSYYDMISTTIPELKRGY
jgi:hypothetical protein